MPSRIFIVCCVAVLSALLPAGISARTVQVSLLPKFGESSIVPEEVFYPLGKDSVSIDVLKFYISDIQLLQGDSVVYKEPGSYHLYNMEDAHTAHISLQVPEICRYDQIQYHLGIDSATNVSGALEGDLDPVKGMYWAWQSGYINCKIEGRSNLCNTRNHVYTFHLGGYMAPHASLQSVKLPAATDTIPVYIQIDSFLKNIDLAKENEIMIPCRQAVSLAEKFAASFVVMQP